MGHVDPLPPYLLSLFHPFLPPIFSPDTLSPLSPTSFSSTSSPLSTFLPPPPLLTPLIPSHLPLAPPDNLSLPTSLPSPPPLSPHDTLPLQMQSALPLIGCRHKREY